jgi:CheY-like chemotaxis protein
VTDGPAARAPRTVTLRCFPRADRTFQRAVERLVASDDGLDPRDPESAARLERHLQERYPGASVRMQDPLATFGAVDPIWYVHRRDAPGEAAEAPNGAAGEPPGDGAPSRAGPATRSGPGTRPVYSVAAAASMVGVPLSVIVAWEADGLVHPSVTRQGQHLYSRNDLDDLLYLKRETTAATGAADMAAGLEARRARRRTGPPDRLGSRRLLVLLAERDPYAAEYAEYFLRTEGYDVEVAFDANEAQVTASSLGPDLAVVELLISGGGGAELCARLKAGGTAAVLAISSLDDEDAALRAGADAFLLKPLDPLEFVSTIKDLLGESALLHRRTPS